MEPTLSHEVLAKMSNGILKLELLRALRELKARGISLQAQEDREVLKALFAMLPARTSRQRPAL